MVRELHKAGIEVILDVVFNHTAESDETGPTLSFRGLDAVCPAPGGRQWYLAVDTGLAGQRDIHAKGSRPHLEPQDRYSAKSRSVVVLLSR